MPNSFFQLMHLSSCCISSHSSLVVKPTQHITQGNVTYNTIGCAIIPLSLPLMLRFPSLPTPQSSKESIWKGRRKEGKGRGGRGEKRGNKRRSETETVENYQREMYPYRNQDNKNTHVAVGLCGSKRSHKWAALHKLHVTVTGKHRGSLPHRGAGLRVARRGRGWFMHYALCVWSSHLAWYPRSTFPQSWVKNCWAAWQNSFLRYFTDTWENF